MNQPPFGPIPAPPPDPRPADEAVAPLLRLPTLLAMLAQLKRSRLLQAGILETTEREISRIEAAMLAAMKASGTTIYASSNALVEIRPRSTYAIASWDEYYAHIKANDAWDLLQRRPSTTALRERGAALPPGVVINTFDEIKFTPKGDNT